MNFDSVTGWIEDHPSESILLGAVGLVGVLWLLGFFSGSGSSSDSGTANMAAAYYAAEAQQAVIGGQIQVANIAATAASAQAAREADAAVSINAAQSNAAVTINQQNAETAALLGNYGYLTRVSDNELASTLGNFQLQGLQNTNATNFNLANTLGSYGLAASQDANRTALALNASDNATAQALGNYGLLATRSNNETIVATNAANTDTAFRIAHDNNLSTQAALMLGTIIPQELILTGGGSIGYDLPGQGRFTLTGTPQPTPVPADTATPGLLASLQSGLASLTSQFSDFLSRPAAAAPAAPLTGYDIAASLGPLDSLWQGHNSALMDVQQALILGNPISAGSWAAAGVTPQAANSNLLKIYQSGRYA